MARKVRAIIINEKDNVATALERIEAGATVSVERQGRTEQINLPSTVPTGHKFALCEIGAGEYVVKYGEPIGQAVVRIRPGEHVHVHNIVSHGKKIRGAQ
ncbi:MAG TPA: UxaA family hydrolase [Syntrophorhabdales bacterium]|nr:UxaA family hydrolase [Syntrophorhabdales bacterium]